ncbi:hypothetical protein TorRG33x02_253460, partial [Trema orientale]
METLSCHTGIGAIIIDSNGAVCDALAARHQGQFGYSLETCLSILEGLKFSISKGLRISVVECTSSIAVNSIRNTFPLSTVSSFISDIRVMCNQLGN